MATKRIVLILAAILALAGCGDQAGPRFSIRTHHPARAIARLACVSQDCGPYAATIKWAGISIANQTGYYVYKDAEQVADVATATYTFHGIDCGTAFTIGVRAHNGTGGTGSLYTTGYSAPSCGGTGGSCGDTNCPQLSAQPTILTPDRAPIEGQNLPTDHGTWTHSPTSYTYQWQRCDELAKNCQDIGGATGAYTLTSSDIGKNLKLLVTACNATGCNTAPSNWTPPIVASNASCTTTLDPSSSDNTPYPGANIQTALSNAAAGSTVCLNAGDYHVSGEVDLYFENPASNVTLQPVPGAVVRVGWLNMNAVSHLTVQGLNLVGGASALNASSNDIFRGNTTTGTLGYSDNGYYFYGNGSSQSNIQVLDNQLDHLEGANGPAGSTGNSQCMTAVGSPTSTNITFSHNICGPGVLAHLTQWTGIDGITEDYNSFIGPASPRITEGYHNNVMQVFGGAPGPISFSNNYMWHVRARGQALLFQESIFQNVTINNNLDVEDPACTTNGALDCLGYAYGLCGAHGYLTFTNNTVVNSSWGNLITHSQNDVIGDCITPGTGENYNVSHNLFIAPGGQANGGYDEVEYAECGVGTCTFDYNVTDDGTAAQDGAVHYVTNWSPAFGDGSSTSYAFPGQWYQNPTGLSFQAGYQH